MARAHEKVSDAPGGNRPEYTAVSAAQGIEQALKYIDGRWKLLILFNLFGGQVLRFSDLERAIPGISQKMLAQQLRRLEADAMVERTVHKQVPPKVEYRLTAWGQSLCPALDHPTDGPANVLRQARRRAAVSGGQGLEAVVRHRLAHARALRLHDAVRRPPNRPSRVQRRPLSRDRFEARHLDGDAKVGIRA